MARALTLRAPERRSSAARACRSPRRACGRIPRCGCRPRAELTSGRLELVNGRPPRAEAEARTTLAELLRGAGREGRLRRGRCGAHAVRRPLSRPSSRRGPRPGRSVVTVEGLGTAERPHPLQAAFAEASASPCGFCAPSHVLAARVLLDAVPQPSEADVRDALAGLCRCTGYAGPVAAVMAQAAPERP